MQLGVLLTCSCGWQAYLFNERFGPVALHALTCPDHIPYRERNQVMLPLILLDPTVSSQCQGRGQALLTCGDIESNPVPPDRTALLEAPNPPTRGRHSGRGEALTSCGDVEPNPGPPKPTTPQGDLQMDEAGNRLPRRDVDGPVNDRAVRPELGTHEGRAPPRRATMFACPLPGCLAGHQHLSSDSMIKHLGRIHVQAGQGITQQMLDKLGVTVCTPCRHLIRSDAQCSFCEKRQRIRPGAQGANEARQAGADHAIGPAPPICAMEGTPLSHACPEMHPSIDEVLQA